MVTNDRHADIEKFNFRQKLIGFHPPFRFQSHKQVPNYPNESSNT